MNPKKNEKYSFSKLPHELYQMVGEFIGAAEFESLSLTSNQLRQNYQINLYKHCYVSDYFSKEMKVTNGEWAVPDKVLLNPKKYSWFNPAVVRTLRVTSEKKVLQLVKHFKLELYPKLKSMELSGTSQGSIVLTQATPIQPDEVPNKLMLAPADHSLAPFEGRRSHIVCYDLIAAIKNKENLYSGVHYDAATAVHCFHMTYYNLCCNTDYTFSSITSLVLLLKKTSYEGETKFGSLYSLDSFPNLKRVNISSSSTSTSFSLFQKVIKSLENCVKLKQLDIHCANSGMNEFDGRFIAALDNLVGHWKKYTLNITHPSKMIASTVCRLPSVDELYVPGSFFLIRGFEVGERLSMLTLLYDGDFDFFGASSYKSILGNLSTLSLQFLPNEDFGHKLLHVLDRPLPKLKKFAFTVRKPFPSEDYMEHSLKRFKAMLDKVPFGEFDIYNIDHITPAFLIQEWGDMKDLRKKRRRTGISRSCFYPRFEFFDAKKSEEDYKEVIADPDSPIEVVYNKFFDIIAQHVQENARSVIFSPYVYVKRRVFMSILFLDILQYLPNLEALELNNISSFDEYFTLHRLIKYHKKLNDININSASSSSRIDEQYYGQVIAPGSLTSFSSYDSAYLNQPYSDFTTILHIDREMINKRYEKVDDFHQHMRRRVGKEKNRRLYRYVGEKRPDKVRRHWQPFK